jgi:L-2-hydroxyglutarate oxidase LhgO
MQNEEAEVLIVGAGLQGCSIALELARLGVETLLVDRAERPFERASLRNEGKIHLGLVYAADRSLETARLQLRGALSFQAAIER